MYGERLKELREASQMSQAQLARNLGTNQQSISRYETEQIEPNIKMKKKFCFFLKGGAFYGRGRRES